jgi:LysM repeat protein
MTIGGPAAIASEDRSDIAASITSLGVPDRVLAICPFLLGPHGGRTIEPSRDQRCTAVAPAVLLAPDKQRRLCLSTEHATCATYLAALEAADEARKPAHDNAGGRHGVGGIRGSRARDEGPIGRMPETERINRWPIPLTAPVVLEQAHPVFGLALLSQRSMPQVGLAVLMVIAFGVLLAGRIGPGQLSLGANTANATLPPSAVATSPAVATPLTAVASQSSAPASIAPSPSASPSASAAPSIVVAASSSPKPTLPTTGRTYTVHAGDTLAAIAARFGTTVKAISTANHIADPRLLHIGQVLAIP